MCGILFSLSNNGSILNLNDWNHLKDLNTKRGPDSQLLKQLNVKDSTLQFFSTVLHLRGPDVVPQPIEDSENILCWNGEIFGGLQVEHGQNDTQALMSYLRESSSQDEILSIFSRIEGPYAFVFWQASTKKLWFGRDCLGRRSLLTCHKQGSLMLSSVGLKSEGWKELEANGIYCIDFSEEVLQEGLYKIHLFPWSYSEEPLLPFPRLNTTIPDHLKAIETPQVEPLIDEDSEQTVNDFISVLSQSVKSRVADIPHLSQKNDDARVAILFSGGIDCTFLAALADHYLPKSEPIDLLNVAFENPRSEMAKNRPNKKKNKQNEKPEPSVLPQATYNTPDRVTGRASLEELRRIAPDRSWNFVEINVPYVEALEYRQHIIDLMFPLDTVMDMNMARKFVNYFVVPVATLALVGTAIRSQARPAKAHSHFMKPDHQTRQSWRQANGGLSVQDVGRSGGGV
ncbi:hypothetical protein G6F51_006847 [Rhizopus arrhizus]|uniref:Glutamine amidotransferase type-2 domain-containing protein n=1 Tax=Rhizopus oryzae TaxID=64495 RepID=A0A9P7CA46_RHIOR|nr:hypothetical protein G6F51_006847 [Rhizopus arrhizus]